MARLDVQWVNESEIKSFPEIAHQPGYYLDVLTGDLFRNDGHFTEANQRILAEKGDGVALRRKAFLLVSRDLTCSLEEVKEMASEKFGVRRRDMGKLVHSLG